MAKEKFGGFKEFIDRETGEVVPFQVTYEEKGTDFNFRKIYAKNYVASIGCISNKKQLVCNYIIEHTDHKNLFIGTYEQIASDTGIGVATVSRCVNALLHDADPPFFVRLTPGALMINPDIMHYGTHENKIGMLKIFVDHLPEDKKEELANKQEKQNQQKKQKKTEQPKEEQNEQNQQEEQLEGQVEFDPKATKEVS